MNDRELLYVKYIADTKSISKAAKKLYIAQPSLSQALQKIEEEIGTPLFVRKQRGMELTLAGEKYYIAAKEILDIYDDFINEISYINDYKKGRLTIGIANFLGTFLLPKILPSFTKDYPNIEIYVEEQSTVSLEKMVVDGTVDFAVMHGHELLQSKNINYEILHKDPFVVIAKKGHPLEKIAYKKNGIYNVDIKDLQGHDMIVLDKDKGIRQISEIIWNEAEVSPKIKLTTKNFETAKRLAIEGVGITILPSEYIQLFPFENKYNSFLISGTENSYWNSCILTKPSTYLSKISNVFIETIKEYYKKNQPF